MGRLGRLLVVVAALVLLVTPAAWGVPVPGTADGSESYVPRGPILVQGDLGFHPGNGVVAGSGTPDDPYVIRGWEVRNTVSPNIPNPEGAVPLHGCSIVLEDTRAHVVIEGNRVTHTQLWRSSLLTELGSAHHAGICILGGENVTVQGNLVHWVLKNGIVLTGAHNVEIVENVVHRSWNWHHSVGILQEGGSNITLQNNTVTMFQWGMTGVTSGTTIAGNVLDGHKDGALLITADGPMVVEENTFGDEVEVRGSENVTLRGNVFDWSHLKVKGVTAHVVARNNSFLERAGAVVTDTRESDDRGPVLDARWNWWGSSDGPDPEDLEEKGENTTLLVDPWLTEEPARHVGGEGAQAGASCYPVALCEPGAWTGPFRS